MAQGLFGRPARGKKCDANERTFKRGPTNECVRLLSQELNITKTIVHEIVTNNSNMQKVPKVLTDDQKSRRVEMCQENPNVCESDRELSNNVITGDEFQVFEYDPESKRQFIRMAAPPSSPTTCPKQGWCSNDFPARLQSRPELPPPSDFFLFPRLKVPTKDERFETITSIQADCTAAASRSNSLEEAYHGAHRMLGKIDGDDASTQKEPIFHVLLPRQVQ